MSNKIQVFDLSNAPNVSLTRLDSRERANRLSNVCKITDATIVFVGDNSKFTKHRKKLLNTFSITLPKEQSEEFKRILDETKRENHPYSEYDGEIQFKVKLSLNTKIVNNDKKPIKIDLRNVPCADLREYKDVRIDIAVTQKSREFEDKNGQTISYTTLTATQIKIKDKNSVFDYDFL